MKRAPVIPKHTLNTQPVEDTSLSTPAAPMVDSLIARVGAMARGNAITLPVCGRDVKFTLEVLRGDSVEKTSRVWSGNERDQELLTEDALDDLIPSFLLTGQQTPAFGRRVSGVIEIADGSRRRKAAALTESDYRVLVGELDDEQMAMIDAAVKAKKPILAICRGMQLVNVYFGGTLIQDLENGTMHKYVPNENKLHDTVCISGTPFAIIYGDTGIVNSAQHQAVKKLGKGFKIGQPLPVLRLSG